MKNFELTPARERITQKDFSTRTGISCFRLRNLAKKGLLVPTFEENGRKFYAEAQIADALQFITPVVKSPADTQAQAEYLKDKIKREVKSYDGEISHVVTPHDDDDDIDDELIDPPEISDKKNKLATPAASQNAVQITQKDNSTSGDTSQVVPVDSGKIFGKPNRLANLPEKILSLKRFFPVRITAKGKKVPCIENWENPASQMFIQDAIKKTGQVGFDISGHSQSADFFFVDCDNIFDDSGNIIYPEAKKWFNYLSTAETFCEKSISKKGCHFLFRPTQGIFPKLIGGEHCSIFFDKDNRDTKIELFYLQNRYCLVTGDLLNCQPNTPIVEGEIADEFIQQLLNNLTFDNSRLKDSDARIIPTDISFDEVQKMLDVIPCDKMPYFDWWKIGAIIHYHFGKNGFELWRAWSEIDQARYTFEACQKVWSDLDKRSELNIGEPAKIGSLIFFAKKFGYKPQKNSVETSALMTDDGNDRTQDFISDCPINLRIPTNFVFDNKGIRHITPPREGKDEPPKVKVVARTPLVITKVFTVTKSHDTQYEVAMKIGDSWRIVNADGRTLQDPRRVLDLTDKGALIEEPAFLAKYFSRLIACNRDVIKQIKVYTQPGWHDDQFIYPSGGTDYICSRNNVNYEELFATNGDPELWKKKMHEITCGNQGNLKRITLGAFHLSPMLKILHLPNFWLHIQGPKNYAKTPLIKFGVSPYGNPAETYLLRTFDSSPKNRVTMAVAMNDLPQALDELETLSPKEIAEVQKSVYDYVSGMDGQKNQKSGDVRAVTRFRGVRVSTGERPILEQNAKGGAFKRCITLHISEPLFSDEEARKLHIFCEKHHGHFGRIWTTYISEHEEEILTDFESVVADIQSKAKEFEPAHVRACAACAVAFWHFRHCLNLDSKFEWKLARADAYLILKNLPTQDEISDTKRGIDLLASWIDEHPKNFIEEHEESGDFISALSFGETSGIKFADGSRGFFRNAFRRIVETELHLPSYEKFLNELFDEGKLICPSRREKAKSVRLSRNEVKKVYLFKAGVLSIVDNLSDETISDYKVQSAD